MKDIQPVHLHDTGPKVSNLHKGLLFLILNQPGISDNDRKILQQRLEPERSTQTFGDVTAELVGTWQYQFKNWPNYLPVLPKRLKAKVQNLPISPITGRGNGDVDEVTARALNWLLKKLGAP
jgi:hypothetical protein